MIKNCTNNIFILVSQYTYFQQQSIMFFVCLEYNKTIISTEVSYSLYVGSEYLIQKK